MKQSWPSEIDLQSNGNLSIKVYIDPKIIMYKKRTITDFDFFSFGYVGIYSLYIISSVLNDVWLMETKFGCCRARFYFRAWYICCIIINNIFLLVFHTTLHLIFYSFHKSANEISFFFISLVFFIYINTPHTNTKQQPMCSSTLL